MFRKQDPRSASVEPKTPPADTPEPAAVGLPESGRGSVAQLPANKTAEPLAPPPGQLKPLDPAWVVAPAEAKRRRISGRRLALGAALAVTIGGGGWFGYNWWTVGLWCPPTTPMSRPTIRRLPRR
jgi:membrane fusion protein, multidrug efflux system